MKSATDLAIYTKEDALFEITLRNADTASARFEDVVVEAIDHGIPAEIVTRFRELWEYTKKVAGEVIAVGRILVQEIMAFLRENPGIKVGIALGAVVGSLITAIPFFGGLLMPLSMALGALYGAAVGATYHQVGQASSDPLALAVALAEKFTELLRRIFVALTEYFTPKSEP